MFNIYGAKGAKLCYQCKETCCLIPSSPFLTESDVDRIKSSTNFREGEFSETKITKSKKRYRKIKTGNLGNCMFYDHEKALCTIYSARPVDCQLFPLDIHQIDGIYYWILYEICPLSEVVVSKNIDYAEEFFLPQLKKYLEQYAEYDFPLFDENRWKIIRPFS